MKRKIFTTVFCAFCAALALQAQDLYQIGDIVEFNGTKGYVYKVTSNGRHGYAISLAAFETKKICTDKALSKMSIKTTEDDGVENAKIVEKFAIDNGKTLAVFPAYEWAKSLGEGWYIPSVAELKEALEILSTKPDGYPDDGEEEEASEASADQSVATQDQEAASASLDYKKYAIKLSTKAKKFVNSTSDKFKEEGGVEFVKSQSFSMLQTSTIFGVLPLKYATKALKEAKKDPNAIHNYDQYLYAAHVIYYNEKPAAAISMWANLAFGGNLKVAAYGYQYSVKPNVRAIYKF